MLNTPIKPMLLHKSDSPPSGNLVHQLKFDGFRCLLHYDQGQVRLFTRHQNECTIQFPEIQPNLNCSNAIIDGEMIVMDGVKPCWESVMKRFNTTKPISIKYLMSVLPAHFVAFDIIYVNNQSVVSMPLIDRLNLLETIVEPSNSISICPSSSDGQQLFNRVKELGLEGVCSKSLNSRYLLDTRSDHWLKTKAYMYETVTITGIKKDEFACSLVKDGKYIGTMEFASKEARSKLYQRSKGLISSETNDWRYLQPKIQCKVKFQCYTKSGFMRSPSFVEFVS
ncbi:DNA polymerase LigD [Brevibacillus brevis X23]|nr:DNA polymerase LigD [Brevibacillus brevis X23]